MVFFAAALGFLLHLLFWGAGLAALATPRRWRRCWPVFVPLAGVALQSAVVWAGVKLGLEGTDAYARAALLLPAGLLAWAWWRDGAAWTAAWRRFAALWAVMLVILAALTWPMAGAARSLTTLSLGSCDAADYAAGARVLQEFARTERGGFIGLTEVVAVQSVDNFFDYWTRLNHFTPAALLALNASVSGLAPYRLISVAGAVFLVAGLPLVFWLARSLFRIGPWGALLAAATYGSSPLLWYAVAHGSLSQLLAAPAIGLITWAGVALWRSGARWREAVRLAGLAGIGGWLILGGYNFMVVACLVPVAVFVTMETVRLREVGRLMRWVPGVLAPLVATALVFPERMLGLAERFRLFQEYDFGWRIPRLTLAGWYGWVRDTDLHPVGGATGLIASVLLGLALVAALAGMVRRRRPALALSVGFLVPVAAGYYLLHFKGEYQGTNASYDAYKLLATFYPGVLVALLAGLVHLRTRRGAAGVLLGAAGILLLAGNAAGAWRFARGFAAPTYIVDRDLAALGALERDPSVGSINLVLEDFWDRIWANSFLLRKPQYFASHTYEGRKNTALKGDWDLDGGLVRVRVEGGPKLVGRFSLIARGGVGRLEANLGEGWHAEERTIRPPTRWRWSTGRAEVVLRNPQSGPARVRLTFEARALTAGALEVSLDGKPVGAVEVGIARAAATTAAFAVPPGEHRLTLTVPAARVAGPGDARVLGIALYSLEVHLLAPAD
jgi:hypothetical protein